MLKKLLLVLASASAAIASPQPALADYSGTVASSPGLSSYWRFAETSGTTAADSSGGRTATLLNGTLLGQSGAPLGSTDGAAGFDGVDDAATVGDAYDFAGTTPFTLESWVKPSSVGAADRWRRIVSKEASSTAGYAMYIFPDSVGEPRRQRVAFERRGDGSVDTVRSTSALVAGRWSHVVVSYDGARLQMYVNGKLEGTTDSRRSLPSTSAAFRLGSASAGGGHLGGLLDEVAVYSNALSSTAVSSHYAAGTTSTQTPTPTPTPAPTTTTDSPLFSDSFTGSDGIITSSDQYWGGGSTDPNWEGESGTMYRRGNTAWTNSAVYRFWTKRSDFTNVRVEMDLKNNGYFGTYRDWDGVKIWLRRQYINGSSSANVKPGLYTAEVNRRQGNVIIQKKCAGQDDYTVLAATPWSGNPNPARIGVWERVGGTIRTNTDGSVTVQVIRNGTVVLAGTDRGNNGCGIITVGKVGVRSDNVDQNVDNFTVRSM